jgi:Branched-chain amino acid transport system / permease component/ATP dependent DNA ligase domain
MKFTFMGKALRAVAQDRETAGLMGVNPNQLIMLTFVIASALAGMGGAMLGPILVLTIARKDGDRVRLYSRPGNDMTRRFPLIAEALTGLRSRSCIIDGEAVACDDNGLASFERIRYRRHDGTCSCMPSTSSN